MASDGIEPEPRISLVQLALKLEKSPSTINRFMRAGMPYVRLGKTPWFYSSQVYEWFRRTSVPPRERRKLLKLVGVKMTSNDKQ
jgi:hypothetical protein